MQSHHWIGLLALLTVIVVGVAIGHLLGLSAGEGVYLTAFILTLIGWLAGRRVRRQEGSR